MSTDWKQLAIDVSEAFIHLEQSVLKMDHVLRNGESRMAKMQCLELVDGALAQAEKDAFEIKLYDGADIHRIKRMMG
jgi:hypothetical protein